MLSIYSMKHGPLQSSVSDNDFENSCIKKSLLYEKPSSSLEVKTSNNTGSSDNFEHLLLTAQFPTLSKCSYTIEN